MIFFNKEEVVVFDEILCKLIKLVFLMNVLVVNIFLGIVGDSDDVKVLNWLVIFWLIVYSDIKIW